MKKELCIGVDIGGTNTVIGIVDKEGSFLFQDKIHTHKYDTAEYYSDALGDLIGKGIASISGNTVIKGVGIGAPNGNFYNGTIEFAPNLRWKGIIPLAKMIHDRVKLPVILTNDANAAALGEMVYGAAKGMKDIIVITLGTGLGSGLIVNGQLVYGHDGFAGEIGHTIIYPDGRDCGCGRKGCLETYCSATGIVRTAREMIKRSPNPGFWGSLKPEEIDSKVIFEAAKNGDRLAKEAFEYTGNILGLALANSVAHTSPEAIFLFGGLANAGDFIFKPTKLSFEKNLLEVYKGKIKILPSGLKESDAAVLGAASLIWHNY
jgi:glucokinase